MSEAQIVRCANCGALNRATAGTLGDEGNSSPDRTNSRFLLTSRETHGVCNNSSAQEDRPAAPPTIIPPQKRITPEPIADSLTVPRD